MERDALIIKNLALEVVNKVPALGLNYEQGEQVQRLGTALHLFFSEVAMAGKCEEARCYAHQALAAAQELRKMTQFVNIPGAGAKKMELLVFTLNTYCADGKFRKFARHKRQDNN